MKKYGIRNAGKEIGFIGIFPKNVRLVATMVGLGVTLTFTGCGKKEEVNNDIKVESLVDYTYNPTYVITYTIKKGDTLNSIVGRYIEDETIAKSWINKIIIENDIENPNLIIAGQELELYGIPEDKLEEFGYSTDYSKFPINYEIEDRIEFASDSLNYWVASKDDLEEYNDVREQINDLKKVYADYHAMEDSTEKDNLADYLLVESLAVCHKLNAYTGVDFEKCKTAYPIEMSKDKDKNEEYGLG